MDEADELLNSSYSTQREFTDAGETPHCPHLFIKIKYKTIRHIIITRTDLSPIPVRSAVKSNFTSCYIYRSLALAAHDFLCGDMLLNN